MFKWGCRVQRFGATLDAQPLEQFLDSLGSDEMDDHVHEKMLLTD